MENFISRSDFNPHQWLKSVFTCCGFCTSVGFLFGWILSLFLTCGKFNIDQYVQQALSEANCTQIISLNCQQIELSSFRQAQDFSLRACFQYCGWSSLTGALIALMANLCYLCYICYPRKSMRMINCLDQCTGDEV